MAEKKPPAEDSGPSIPPPPPQYAQPPAHAQIPPAPGQAYPQPQYVQGSTTNVLAILSLVFSLLGLLCVLPVLGSIAGVIMGHIGMRQIRDQGQSGEGMAKAGLIIGYIGGGLGLLAVIAYVMFFVVAFASVY